MEPLAQWAAHGLRTRKNDGDGPYYTLPKFETTERDGLIIQTADADDKRFHRLQLSSLGRKKLSESEELWRAAQRGFEKGYGKDQSAELRTALAIIVTDELSERFARAAQRRQVARLPD